MVKCDSYETVQVLKGWSDAYTPIYSSIPKHVCRGTREKEECRCGGDRTKCDFYPEIRTQAKKEEAYKHATKMKKENKQLVQLCRELLNDLESEHYGVVENCYKDLIRQKYKGLYKKVFENDL